MENFIAGVCVLCVFGITTFLVFEALQPDTIYPDRFHKAEALCENNKGMKELEIGYGKSHVRCNDGATFKFEYKSNSEV